MTQSTIDPNEGNLHALTDDVYFTDLAEKRVTIYDADGNEVTGIYDDVIDARAEKKAGLL